MPNATTFQDMATENEDPEDSNDFIIYTDEDDMSDGYNGDSEWDDLPPAATYAEHLTKKKKAPLMAAMRHAEEMFDGQKDKTGILRGPYCIGGLSKCSIQRKEQAARKGLASGMFDESGFQKQMQHVVTLKKKLDSKHQLVLCFKAKQKNSPSDSCDEGPPAKKRVVSPTISIHNFDSMDINPAPVGPSLEDPSQRILSFTVRDCTDASDDELNNQYITNTGKAAPLLNEEEIKEATEVEEVEELDDIMAEEVPIRSSKKLQDTAETYLKKARKLKNHYNEQMYAALIDFYQWQPKMGRIGASLRVARNHGRGKAFAQVVWKQAHHFEGHDTITQPCLGHHAKGTGLLNDEDFYLNLQQWLQTLKAGEVSSQVAATA